MTVPIRVLIAITDLKVGGTPLDVYRLATSLDPAEFDVRVACLAPPGEVSARLEAAGIATFACNARGPRDVGALWRLARLVRAQRPDVLHAWLFHANTAACLTAPAAGLPPGRVITVILTTETERRWHLKIGGMTCRMCRCVVGNSPAVVEHLHRRAHVPRSRLRTIPGGVDVSRFASAEPIDRLAIGVPSDSAMILWVGRLDPVKGLDELVDAVAMLDDRTVRLVLCGEGPYESTIRRRVADAGFDDRVCFLGRRDDIPALLAAADVFVFPSRTEGLPNALLEAMAARCPIVTTDAPGCRDLIADGRTGLIAPPRDPAGLADRIRRLIDDRDLAAALGRAAADHVTAHYDFRTTVAAYAALYRETAAGGII